MNGQPTILLVNGPNLNRLGAREPGIYGSETLPQVVNRVRQLAMAQGISVVDKQTNSEGVMIDFLQENAPCADGVIINPGAFAHYSYALRDCLADVGAHCPIVEVHISNVHQREAFRHESVLAAVVTGQIVGLGTRGYDLALQFLLTRIVHRGAEQPGPSESQQTSISELSQEGTK
ncbi:type II 3-dehydroquinate dehydratase [Alicyclobacillus ferrooxydans]|uniref:type II 3-dehydroquinate dehydratase n=1 Tax=Alicyclobacillus ferrooxydans TaxID=471514 RepID=UPI000A416CFC|nr:type II 3-dehydroquinate dehydratase [Alicyclobacillus ferrooxydans]